MPIQKSLLLTVMLLAGPALAQSSGMSGHAAMPMGSAPSDPGMMESMKKMNDAMSSAPMTGNPDHDFVVMMIPHHQGAIDMAHFELQHGKDPQLRQLARDIVAAQDREIGAMKRWLAQHPAQ